MKARMADAGTKYLAISFCSLPVPELFGRRSENFRLMMPRIELQQTGRALKTLIILASFCQMDNL
jgi:hypothetical protein